MLYSHILCMLGLGLLLTSSLAFSPPLSFSASSRQAAITRVYSRDPVPPSVLRNTVHETKHTVLAYDLFTPPNPKATIVYLPCLFRSKNSAKSANLLQFAKRKGVGFVSADYHGVGRSSGTFQDASLSIWKEDCISLLESLEGERYTLVGAGVGSWVSLLVARDRPDLVQGVVGMSCDPDFTEDLLWEGLKEEDKAEIMEKGVKVIEWGGTEYPISRALIEDGRDNLIMRGGPNSVKIDCPVRLIHGLSDPEVPISTPLALVSCLTSSDCSLTLRKGGTHQLDDEEDMSTMRRCVEEVVEGGVGYDLTSPASG